jgi:hypothetical protein
MEILITSKEFVYVHALIRIKTPECALGRNTFLVHVKPSKSLRFE